MIVALRGPYRDAVPKMPWSGLSPNFRSSTPMRWALRVAALDQHHVGSHRADHGPKHEPGVDLILKGYKLAALRKLAPCLVHKDDRRRKQPPSAAPVCHITVDRDGPVIEVLSLDRPCNRTACVLKIDIFWR